MRILLIHDADEMRSHLAQMLIGGIEALELVFCDPVRDGLPDASFCRPYDLLLVDERPGDGDGTAWLRALRAEAPDVPPAVILCGEVTDALSQAAWDAGAVGCMLKSGIAPSNVAGAIHNAVRHARPDRADAHPSGLAPSPATDAPAPAPRVRATPPPTSTITVPGYRLYRRLGSGPQSRVYLAQRESDSLTVVVKILDPSIHQDRTFRRRFLDEQAILGRLNHDNIAIVYDHGLDERAAWTVTEHFPAGDLRTRMRDEGVGPDVALLMLAQMARGLAIAHAAGILHRNLKPQNVLFRDPLQLALCDFGLARTYSADVRASARREAVAMPTYLSPEQCLGLPHDERGDLYGLGAIFYEMLTGRAPYVADNATDLAFQHVHGTLPRLPAVFAEHQALINRLLAKKPEQRIASANELLIEIGQQIA